VADYYVWSGATGAGTGADWANAYVNLQTAFSGKTAGDVFYVAHDHVQTQASALALTSVGTEAAPSRVYCVDRAGSVPPVEADLRTTAQISTTVASAITLAGSISECYGIIFSAGSGASAASITTGSTASRSWRLVKCALILANTSTSSRITTSAAPGYAIWEDCTVEFGNVSQAISVASRCHIRNTNNAQFLTGSTIPTTLFLFTGASHLFVEGVDLSQIVSAKNLFTSAAFACSAILKDCKLDATADVLTAAITAPSHLEVTLIRCDTGDTNYRHERYLYTGDQKADTTIVRTGGATDGTTQISWVITTNAFAGIAGFFFECMPISIWQEDIGSPITVTIEGIWPGGSVPNTNDIWMDVFYSGTSGTPMTKRATTRPLIITASSALPAGSGTWSGGLTVKFAMSATITPLEKGPITIYIKAAKASSTFYIDPKPVIS